MPGSPRLENPLARPTAPSPDENSFHSFYCTKGASTTFNHAGKRAFRNPSEPLSASTVWGMTHRWGTPIEGFSISVSRIAEAPKCNTMHNELWQRLSQRKAVPPLLLHLPAQGISQDASDDTYNRPSNWAHRFFEGEHRSHCIAQNPTEKPTRATLKSARCDH